MERFGFNSDCIFEILLKKEFLKDFIFCKNLLIIPQEERTEDWHEVFNWVKEKYSKDKCPGKSYNYASKGFQEQYNYIHRNIQRLLKCA